MSNKETRHLSAVPLSEKQVGQHEVAPSNIASSRPITVDSESMQVTRNDIGKYNRTYWCYFVRDVKRCVAKPENSSQPKYAASSAKREYKLT